MGHTVQGGRAKLSGQTFLLGGFVVKSKLLSIGLKTNQKEGLKSMKIRLAFSLSCCSWPLHGF